MWLPGWRAVIARPTPVVVNTATTASASPQNSSRSLAPASSTTTATTRAAIRAPSDQASVFERRIGPIFTSPRIGGNRAGTELGRLRGALGRGDQVADGPLVAGAEELDGVGLAVHDRFEEDLAVLICGQVALGPAAHLVEQLGEPRVGLAVLVGDLGLDALGQGG